MLALAVCIQIAGTRTAAVPVCTFAMENRRLPLWSLLLRMQWWSVMLLTLLLRMQWWSLMLLTLLLRIHWWSLMLQLACSLRFPDDSDINFYWWYKQLPLLVPQFYIYAVTVTRSAFIHIRTYLNQFHSFRYTQLPLPVPQFYIYAVTATRSAVLHIRS